jgi:hypothetical protein
VNLTPNEIDTVEDAGMLDGMPVKLLRTKGGFWMAIGRPKGKSKEEALAAGSHPAIVRYNLERAHPTFQPAMQKSELLADNAKVEKHSHFLSDTLRKSGHDIYSVQTGSHIEFQVTKQNVKLSSVSSHIEDGALAFGDMKIGKEFTRALAGAASEKALECGVNIKIKSK